MRIVGRISLSTQVLGHGTPKQQVKDPIVDARRLILVGCQKNERPVIVKASVIEKRHEPEAQPRRLKVDVGVVPIINKVGSNPHPLWQSGSVDIGGKVVEVAVEQPAWNDVGNRVVDNEGIVFADVKCAIGGFR